MTQPLEITYEMTLEDQVDYNLYLSSKSQQELPWLQGILATILSLGVACFFWIVTLGLNFPKAPLPLLLARWMACIVALLFSGLSVFALVAWVSRIPLVTRWLVRRSVARGLDPQYLGTRQVSLEVEGIRSKSAAGERYYLWKQLTLKQAHGLMLFEAGPREAIVVPERAFANAQHPFEFLEAARELQQKQFEMPLVQTWSQGKNQATS